MTNFLPSYLFYFLHFSSPKFFILVLGFPQDFDFLTLNSIDYETFLSLLRTLCVYLNCSTLPHETLTADYLLPLHLLFSTYSTVPIGNIFACRQQCAFALARLKVFSYQISFLPVSGFLSFPFLSLPFPSFPFLSQALSRLLNRFHTNTLVHLSHFASLRKILRSYHYLHYKQHLYSQQSFPVPHPP